MRRIATWLGRRGERWAMLQFVVSAIAAVVLVVLLVLVAFERAGRAEAVANAEEVTKVAAAGVIAPEIDAGVLAGDPEALARLDRRVRAGLLREPVLRINVFRLDGRLVYSSNPSQPKASRPSPEMREALRTGEGRTRTGGPRDPDSDVPESVQLLDVFEPITTPSGERLLVQSCRRLESVTDDSQAMLHSVAPYLIGGIIALQLLNLPLALALVRRVRRARRHEAVALQREIAASDRERRRLATDLHNGAIQDLAGVSMSLTAARHAASSRGDDEGAAALGEAADGSRRATRLLRHVLVDIYPPNLQRAGLASVLDDLLETVRRNDIEVELDVGEGLEDLPPETAALVYRVTQEAVRNVVAHAGAERLELSIDRDADGALELRVADDGRGFARRGNGNGHVGLTLMHDLVEQAGGELAVTSAPGEGTVVRASVP